MKYPPYSHVILAQDIPAHGLWQGDLATVAVVTVRKSQIEAPGQEERLCVRHAALAA